MWNPHKLHYQLIDEYLQLASDIKKRGLHGLTEEIALRFLMANNYELERTLKLMRDR